MFSCSHFFRTKSKAPCRRELRKEGPKEGLRWRIRGRHVSCQETYWEHSKFLLEIRCFTRPGESRVGSDFCFREHKGTCARQSLKHGNEFARVAKRWSVSTEHKDTCAEWCVWAFREYWETGARTRLDFQNMHISDNKLNLLSEDAQVLNEKTSVLMVNVYLNNGESISSFWAKLHWTFGCVQEQQLRRAQEKVDLGTWVRDSECIYDSVAFHPLDEIYVVARQRNQLGERGSARPFRFSFLSGKRVGSSKAYAKWRNQLEDFQ